ncbi:predicted protein [Naegleria gruberi]|uniref:Predicted protein n=1 Tax=Naegleria gruberi TaxID=5762 RepID=D2VF80_NAEGR|nr:uncharacterized protein NAEGRDRAFT_58016 [Naegleria gruberi]EFC44323.1 predicted protein [Naegleria gruberi]|eukprot:XP_002677067.1 predicted protein [Naegleria gruberi strain NEG-M]
MRLLKGSLLESNINIGLAYSATNYAIEQARLRVNQCRCPSITERNFQRQYVPGVEGFLWNSMKGRAALDTSCPAQSDAPNNWMQMSNSKYFAQISSCNLNDVSNGSPCLFSLALGSTQIQVALASCPSETSGNRATFSIPQRLPYIAIHCKGDDCDKIGYPCQQDSDCGGNSLTCWDVPNNAGYGSNFQFGFGFFFAGIYNQFQTCKSPEQLIDSLMKTMLANHWSQTSTKTYTSIKMCGPKLAPILSPGANVQATCTAKVVSRTLSESQETQQTAVVPMSADVAAPTSVVTEIAIPQAKRTVSSVQDSVYYCGGVDSTSASVCSGNGYCSLVAGNIGVCKCNYGYAGSLCSQAIMCGSYNSTNPSVCNGRGSCHTIAYNPLSYCSCTKGYTGAQCEYSVSCPSCQNGGVCVASSGVVGKCQCTGTKFTGELCEKPVTCNGIAATSPDVCSGHGSCVFATPNFEDAATTSTEVKLKSTSTPLVVQTIQKAFQTSTSSVKVISVSNY